MNMASYPGGVLELCHKEETVITTKISSIKSNDKLNCVNFYLFCFIVKEWMQDTILYKVALPLWTNRECQAEYRKHRVNWNTKSSHVCAGFQQRENEYMQKDTCQVKRNDCYYSFSRTVT